MDNLSQINIRTVVSVTMTTTNKQRNNKTIIEPLQIFISMYGLLENLECGNYFHGIICCWCNFCSWCLREGVKKKTHWICDHDHTSMDPPPSFLRTVIALGYFFRVVFFINWVIRYFLKQILVMFVTNFGYVFGEIYQKNSIVRRNHLINKVRDAR